MSINYYKCCRWELHDPVISHDRGIDLDRKGFPRKRCGVETQMMRKPREKGRTFHRGNHRYKGLGLGRMWRT